MSTRRRVGRPAARRAAGGEVRVGESRWGMESGQSLSAASASMVANTAPRPQSGDIWEMDRSHRPSLQACQFTRPRPGCGGDTLHPPAGWEPHLAATRTRGRAWYLKDKREVECTRWCY